MAKKPFGHVSHGPTQSGPKRTYWEVTSRTHPDRWYSVSRRIFTGPMTGTIWTVTNRLGRMLYTDGPTAQAILDVIHAHEEANQP
jgi:hypothetical protein